MGTNAECLSVPIKEGNDAEHVLYRVKRGSTVHVHPDAGLLGREIVLYTNYPMEGRYCRLYHRFIKLNYLIYFRQEIQTHRISNLILVFEKWYQNHNQ